MDIALHIASDEGWGIASSYAESFDLIARHGVIESDLAGRMVAIASLGNRVAHGYGSIDLERIWRETPHGVTTMREFASAIGAYIAAPPGKPRS